MYYSLKLRKTKDHVLVHKTLVSNNSDFFEATSSEKLLTPLIKIMEGFNVRMAMTYLFNWRFKKIISRRDAIMQFLQFIQGTRWIIEGTEYREKAHQMWEYHVWRYTFTMLGRPSSEKAHER
ncbi:uncharacterized protein LOC126265854 [Aethina tumida]|uniref:uncharacterized protein LOC126265854 n=1 Tax=Aethina tumida TaxID=116153 RepID=UPI002148A70B|nr:uncharacterized protein LOC126265854 [Aethina tumida]